MEGKVLNLLKGYVRIKITGASRERFLNLCAYHRIPLWDLSCAGDEMEACMEKKHFKKIRSMVRKSRVSVKITERHGLPFFLFRCRKRKFCAAAVLFSLFLMAWLSSRVWEITLEGNVSQTDDVIFEYLTEAGIVHGMKKSRVDCQELAADLRNYFTEFSWVSAKLSGTRLIISVKEGILPGLEEEIREPSDLIASEEGIVESIYVRSGVPAVKAGDHVEKGDLLVSGAVPILDDSQAVRSYQYVVPDADLILRTSLSYRDEFPLAYRKKNYTGREKTRKVLFLGGWSFSLPFLGGSYETFDLLSSARQLKLFENFYLPIRVETITKREYYYSDNTYTKAQAEEIASARFREFMKNLEEKGVQIFENDVKIDWNEKSCIVSGTVWIGQNASVPRAIQAVQEEQESDEYG